MQHFRNPGFAPKQRGNIRLFQVHLFHPELDGFNWIWSFDRKMLLFIFFNK